MPKKNLNQYQMFIKDFNEKKRREGVKLDAKELYIQGAKAWKEQKANNAHMGSHSHASSSVPPVEIVEPVVNLNVKVPKARAPRASTGARTQALPHKNLSECAKVVRSIQRENELNRVNIHRLAEGKNPIKRLPRSRTQNN